MSRTAAVCLIGVIALWLVDADQSLAGQDRDFQWERDCREAKVRMPLRGIWEYIAIRGISPEEDLADSNDSFIEVANGDENGTAREFGITAYSYYRSAGEIFTGLREIRFGPICIPFRRNPIFKFESGSNAGIFPFYSEAPAGENSILVTFLNLRGINIDISEIIERHISPQLQQRGINLLPDGSVSFKKEIGAKAGRDGEYDSRSAQNTGPVGYNFFIAFGLWIAAAACGVAGLWLGLLRHNSGALYFLSLLVAGVLAWMGAAAL